MRQTRNRNSKLTLRIAAMLSMSTMKKLITALTLGWALSVNSNAAGADFPEEIPFVPTPIEVVDKMLELAEVKKGDVIYDLGSGDGRIVIRAAKKYGFARLGSRWTISY